ncbi:MAG: GNAT family N-acetyltransferase [Candidatus Nanoarchaeia archaeon]
MKIIKSKNISEINSCMRITKELKEWFDKNAIKNMKSDLIINNTIIAKEKNETAGFLNYNSDNGKIKIIWLGVKKSMQRKKIGTKLIDRLVKEAEKMKINKIEVETLSPEYEYEPYERTRKFYYKNGFKDKETKKNEIKGGDNLLVMLKDLK